MEKGKKKMFVSVLDLANLYNPRIISVVDCYDFKEPLC